MVAALCLSGPIERLGTEPGLRYAKQVMAAAKEIQRAAATRTDRLTASHRSPGGRPPRPSRRSCRARPGPPVAAPAASAPVHRGPHLLGGGGLADEIEQHAPRN